MHLSIFLVVLIVSTCSPQQKGKPYEGNAQAVPGILECERYDEGGEGVAYHDSDSINNGSGKLNPINGDPLHEFRMKEGVDISYTKGHGIDDNPYGKVTPDTGRLYVGWTEPGEWINYSISVRETGDYRLEIQYTANGNGSIGIDIDRVPTQMEWSIPSTHDDRDSVAWRQWHHWNVHQSPGIVNLVKGDHLLTLHTVKHGQMNFDKIEFVRVER